MEEIKFINPKLVQEEIHWFPHKFQQQIIDAYLGGKRKIVVSAGIRSGKSMVCAFIVLLELLSEGKEILVISPSYSLTGRVMDYVKRWLNELFGSVKFQQKPFPKIEIDWSGGISYVEGKSAESPEQILGKSYDLIVIDEASRIPRKLFENYLLPRISEKEGKIVIISTPLRKDWFFEEFMKAKENGAGFQFRSIDNPHGISKEECEQRRKELPKAIFDREFNAVFTDEITSIFPNRLECVDDSLPREAQRGHWHYIGLDLAKEEDWTAISVADKNTNEIIYITRWQKLPYTAQFQKILGIAQRFEPCRIIIDSRNVGAVISDQLRNVGVWVEDFTASGTISKDWKKKGTKAKLVEKAMAMFEAREIKIPRHQDLLDELSTYSYTITPSKNIKYGVPVGLHDDLCDALFLSIWNLRMKKKKPITHEEAIRKRWRDTHPFIPASPI